MEKMKVVSIVPIKLNNERLPGKNTMMLGGQPLITYVQQCLIQLEMVDAHYVYCSDECIFDYLLPGGQFLKRDVALDSQLTNFTQILD